MSDQKTVWQVLEEYCADLKYGEINIKIIIHNGRAIAFDETQPPVRKYKATNSENK